jgi:cell division septation protein DedD
MEIGLKERLIGAAVLVVLGVIVIPLFLKSSPSPDSTVNQAVSLPMADSTAAQPQVSLPLTATVAPATPAIVAATKAPAPAAASHPAPKPAVHAIPRATAPAPVASAPQTSGKWTVQAGSYGSAANADKAAATLKQHGFRANVSHFSKAGHTYYRVRVGAYAERGDAEKAAAAVAKAIGGKPEVVPND